VKANDHGQTPDADAHARVADAFRQEYARVVASVLRIVRDIDLAEEVVQEAFEQALDHWPAAGTPDRPGAWLLTTARRRALDRLRRARRAETHADAIAYEALLGAGDEIPDVTDPETIADDRLRLVFTCCHPGPGGGQPRGPHLETGRRPLDRGDRARLSRARAHDRAAARARQAHHP
jgi:predicted RNA polymerase sigma factor